MKMRPLDGKRCGRIFLLRQQRECGNTRKDAFNEAIYFTLSRITSIIRASGFLEQASR